MCTSVVVPVSYNAVVLGKVLNVVQGWTNLNGQIQKEKTLPMGRIPQPSVTLWPSSSVTSGPHRQHSRWEGFPGPRLSSGPCPLSFSGPCQWHSWWEGFPGPRPLSGPRRHTGVSAVEISDSSVKSTALLAASGATQCVIWGPSSSPSDLGKVTLCAGFFICFLHEGGTNTHSILASTQSKWVTYYHAHLTAENLRLRT